MTKTYSLVRSTSANPHFRNNATEEFTEAFVIELIKKISPKLAKSVLKGKSVAGGVVNAAHLLVSTGWTFQAQIRLGSFVTYKQRTCSKRWWQVVSGCSWGPYGQPDIELFYGPWITPRNDAGDMFVSLSVSTPYSDLLGKIKDQMIVLVSRLNNGTIWGPIDEDIEKTTGCKIVGRAKASSTSGGVK